MLCERFSAFSQSGSARSSAHAPRTMPRRASKVRASPVVAQTGVLAPRFATPTARSSRVSVRGRDTTEASEETVATVAPQGPGATVARPVLAATEGPGATAAAGESPAREALAGATAR